MYDTAAPASTATLPDPAKPSQPQDHPIDRPPGNLTTPLAELTDDNLHALAQAITGHPSGDTHDPTAILSPTGDPVSGHPTVRDVVRINQIITTLTADITPDEPDPDSHRE